MESMDRISELSDELLIKILLFLPTEVAVSTSLLSKRWECLWMWLPKLEFSTRYSSDSWNERLRCFLDRNLALHRAPVIESLHLELSKFRPEDVKMCVLAAVSHIIHELTINSNYSPEPNILPSRLFACKSLVTLKLKGKIVLDVPRLVCLSYLKSLDLYGVSYSNHRSFQRLLSICPVLEDLRVERWEDDNMGNFSVVSRSLQRLSIKIWGRCDLDGYAIDTPSLENFNLVDYFESYDCLIENMPKLKTAYVDVSFLDIKSLIGSITAVKELTICLEVLYGDDIVFKQLEHLNLCVHENNSLNLLVRLLEDSPKLHRLDLFQMACHDDEYSDRGNFCWNQPSTVPECLLSSLQTFVWTEYEGTPEERDLVVFILKNARHLKTTTIFTKVVKVPKLQMIHELSLTSRASTMCQLTFR